jgi:hypothetical protein
MKLLKFVFLLSLAGVAVLVSTCKSTPPSISLTALPSKSTFSPLPTHFFITPTGNPIPESTFDLKPPSTETPTLTPTSTPTLGKVEKVISGHFAGWYRYTHPKYGFAFYFPPDWKISDEGEHSVFIVSPTEPGFELHIGFKSVNETDIVITRTGLGEGDILTHGSVRFLGKSIPREVLIYQGEVLAVLYNHACETRVNGLIFTLSLDYLDVDNRAIPVEIQTIADRIVESFEWVNL